MSFIRDIEKWKSEILFAEEFRKKEFGEYSQSETMGCGYNIDYFEKGFVGLTTGDEDIDTQITTTLNLFHAITKIVVPSLIFQNPKILTTPSKIESQDTAPIVSQTCNHYYRKMGAENVNRLAAWDAYVLGMGITKTGYATKFGKDKEDEKKKTSIVDKTLISLGLKKPKEEDRTRPEIDITIESESPYISYVNPFNFGIDPRATKIEDAMYVYEKFRKTLRSLKGNKKYKNVSKLRGTNVEVPSNIFKEVSPSEIEDFKFVDVYEIHYRGDEGIYNLVLANDENSWIELYHEVSIYDTEEWQYDVMSFNKHGHRLYSASEMTKIKTLQDRFNITIEAILEQVDKFHPKVAYSVGDVTNNGLNALRDGGIGALIECNKNPREALYEIGLTQLKADLQQLSSQIIDFIAVQTGVTKTQLLGVASGETATAETIAQGGQTIRMGDMNREVNRFLRSQASKLWKVIKQFVELEELQLINGISGINQETGLPVYDWLTITPEKAGKMQEGEYDFDIEVGSTQKPDLAVVRKQFENLFNILARTDVIVLMQQQGKKVDLAELLRMYLMLFPEMIKDIGRIIQNIGPGTTGLVPPEVPGQGGTTQGSANNALASQMGAPTPTMPNQIGASL